MTVELDTVILFHYQITQVLSIWVLHLLTWELYLDWVLWYYHAQWLLLVMAIWLGISGNTSEI